MLKVPPAPLLTASHCLHGQCVQAAEERSRRTELIAHGKGKHQREEFRQEDVKSLQGMQAQHPGTSQQRGVFSEEQSDAILTNSWYIDPGPPKLRKDT